ncbi:MAG: glutathione peroxidase [Chitinophagaceae bacterium]|nr:MAG: glutathione peroxidase [Chitinophagaceae bacterium]
MTIRQMILKATYPVFMWWTNVKKINTQAVSSTTNKSIVSFYSLTAMSNNGEALDFSSLKGKKVMLVNTASDCGYTNQYADLQKLHEEYKEKLVLIGFPANDFKEQEKGSDEEIASFCKLNYGVTFLIMKKSVVKKGVEQNSVYQWLSDASKNGWNNKQPAWNFCKYIVDENGELTHFFGATISPLSKEVLNAIE